VVAVLRRLVDQVRSVVPVPQVFSALHAGFVVLRLSDVGAAGPVLALVSTRGASFSAPLYRSSPDASCPNPDALAGSKAMSYSAEYTELLSPWLRLRKLRSTSEIFEL